MSRDDEIRARAHRIWQDEGEPEGRHEDHWTRAKAELDEESGAGDVGGSLGGQMRPAEPAVNAGSVSGPRKAR
ncbi:DUF2934 domain-containing protein [Falsirhodobacter algicola]|uniref:DUF2934 domain-containing protein n=1 Tax=Falsirhodobacter algicola TaxID=2692330 RepID=A0A8J8SM92_9RHOB|nr:DUF2934 domain-containing protein [Falsirhodobacter algicola]QUS37214.1 DUF2934 domain-containing protein [Falsirhodobacter algicola]